MKGSPYLIIPTRRKGFTLVEILVATAIMAILVIIVLGITSNVLTGWNRSTGLLTTNQEARVSLNMLSGDMETSLMRRDGNQWLYFANEAGSGDFEYFKHASRMHLFSPVADRPRQDINGVVIHGDVCGVSYQLFYQNPFGTDTPGSERYGLYRAVVPGDATFFGMLGSGNQDDLVGLWADSITFTRDGATLSVDLDDYKQSIDNFLSANVVDFAVILWYPDANTGVLTPVRGTVNAPLPLQPGDEVIVGRSMSLNGGAPLPHPAQMEVSLTLLSSDGASLLQQEQTAGTLNQERFDTIVSQYSHSYSRRVVLKNNPL